jgi:hypothetical protein
MQRSAVVRGASRLAFDAIEQLTHVVEAMHSNIAAGPAPLGRGTDGRTRGITGLVYGSIRGVNAAARALLDHGLGLLPAGEAPPARPAPDAWRAVLNGVVGDHLAATRNPLAIPLRLRRDGPARPRVVLLVHGLCMDDRGWQRNGHDHGAALARELEVTPVYAHYNSGRRVAENGRALADALEALLAEWPAAEPELSIVAHSMGGLVARSACQAGAAAGHAWPARLRTLVFLGTPHHGAPLERGGHRLETLLGVSPYVAPLARLGMLRSAGITDLRHGDGTPLPEGVDCHAFAAGRDRLVPVASALGRHHDHRRALVFPRERRWVFRELGHFDLLDDAGVYARLREVLAPAAPGAAQIS